MTRDELLDDLLDEAAMFNPVGVGVPVGYELDEAQWDPKTKSWVPWTPDPPNQLEIKFGAVA